MGFLCTVRSILHLIHSTLFFCSSFFFGRLDSLLLIRSQYCWLLVCCSSYYFTFRCLRVSFFVLSVFLLFPSACHSVCILDRRQNRATLLSVLLCFSVFAFFFSSSQLSLCSSSFYCFSAFVVLSTLSFLFFVPTLEHHKKNKNLNTSPSASQLILQVLNFFPATTPCLRVAPLRLLRRSRTVQRTTPAIGTARRRHENIQSSRRRRSEPRAPFPWSWR